MRTDEQKRSLRGSLLLLLGAVIWGAAFVAQRMGMDHVSPFTFTGIRMLLAGLVMLPVIAVRDRKAAGKWEKEKKTGSGEQLKAGLICGTMLFAATSLQQAGLVYTTAGKAGFITALYVVLVPVAAWILFRNNPGKVIWISVITAVAALYLLCVAGGSFVLQTGDAMMLGCAVCFTFQILAVDRFAPRVDPLKLSCTQFMVTGILGMIFALATETIDPEGIREAVIPILYTGILSGAVGYTLQVIGQRDTDPTVASLIMCLESVFATLTGALVLGERMSAKESAGCALMFAAVIIAQLSPLISERIGRRRTGTTASSRQGGLSGR